MRIKLFVFLILCNAACNKITPAGFWNNYQLKYLVENLSDQTFNRGTRAMYWNFENNKIVSKNDIIDFTKENGWELIDSFRVKVKELKAWNYNHKSIFPLSYTGFNAKPINDSMYEYFPRWINNDLIVYRFKTGWLVFDPGTNKSEDINGFVVLSSNRKEMSVYHLWGE